MGTSKMNISIQKLTKEDLPHISYLSPPDWNYDISIPFDSYLTNGYCIPLKLLDSDLIIGVGNVIMLGDTAWLSQIIVAREYRGKGLGTMITRTLLASIPSHIHTVQLIATDLGFPVYKKLGFTIEDEYLFYLIESRIFPTALNPVPFEIKYIDQLFDLDCRISGEKRNALFSQKILDTTRLFFKGTTLVAYSMPDLGETLIVSEDCNTGIDLLKEHICKKKKIVFPSSNIFAVEWMERNHFMSDRKAYRMSLGKKLKPRLGCIYNRIGGNLG